MTSTPHGTCADCGRPRKSGAVFCECGALLDYSAPAGKQAPPDVQALGGNGAATSVAELEWPPGPFQPIHEPATTAVPPMRVIHCPNEECGAPNPANLFFCWKCETPLIHGEDPAKGSRLRRALRLEKQPLRAGQRTRPRKPFFGAGRVTRRGALIVVASLVALTALLVAAVRSWQPAEHDIAHWYGVSREAILPRFDPVYPSSVNPPRRTNPMHPPADAFDRNLSTYWRSLTPRYRWDRIRVSFNPAAKEIDEVSIYAGDPTAVTIVPRSIQMTFYRWEPHPSLHPEQCEHPLKRAPTRTDPSRRERGAFCVTGIAKVVNLLNTPAVQWFSTGTQRNISQVVITVRGVHRADDPKARAALTDIEFFAKH